MTFLEAMRHRFACRNYLDKPISKEDLAEILEYGRLSPSSFGFEAWAFHVTEGAEREKLYEAAFSQPMLLQAPLSIIILARRGKYYDPDGAFVWQRDSRYGDPKPIIEDYRGFYEFLRDEGRLDAWSKSQCYLAGANMMTGAKSMGIDSCALEGFDNAKVLAMLGLSGEDWMAALVIPFGYSAVPETPKTRAPMEDLLI